MLKLKRNLVNRRIAGVLVICTTLGIGATFGLSRKVSALDVVTAPIQVFTHPCSNWLRYKVASAFCYTQKHTYTYSRDKGYGAMDLVMFLVGLPFMILDEKTNTTVLDVQALLDQGYTEQEILSYKADLEFVDKESLTRKVTSEDQAINLLDELMDAGKLAPITVEIMGI